MKMEKNMEVILNQIVYLQFKNYTLDKYLNISDIIYNSLLIK